MQFYRKKARSMGVPIVPMIDILTILLIFFIVHTQWKKPQSLLKICLLYTSPSPRDRG